MLAAALNLFLYEEVLCIREVVHIFSRASHGSLPLSRSTPLLCANFVWDLEEASCFTMTLLAHSREMVRCAASSA